jgi:hypothetical protein
MAQGHARGTLEGVKDKALEAELSELAAEFEAAPKRLQAGILKAAAAGENANQITRAIRQAYSPDYVRRLIREAREKGKIPPRGQQVVQQPTETNTEDA